MARAGVTYIDVTKAAEAIKIRGQEPTVDRVREYLGTGSKSTIAPLLKRWRSYNGNAADVSGLPNDLVEVVKSLHERVQKMAEHKIGQAKQEFQAINEDLRRELTETRNTITQFTSSQQDMEQKIQRLSKEKSSLSQSLEDARVAIAKSESQRDEAVSRVAELKATMEDLKQENRDIRDHFEHYQQRTAEDRQQEREQFRTTNQQLHGQIQVLSNQLSQSESRISNLLEANAELQKTTNKLNESNHTLQLALGKKTEEIQILNRELEASLTKRRESHHQNEALREKVAKITNQQSADDKEIALLTQALKNMEVELGVAKDKVALLTDENKVILQEKSVIQGQLKQLQSSVDREPIK